MADQTKNWTPIQWAVAWAGDAGWNKDEMVVAVAIAMAESGCNPKAVNVNGNGSRDWGVWQINDVNKPSDIEKTDGAENAKKAYDVFKSAGNKFTPWVTYNNGAYRKFLPDAQAAYAVVMKGVAANATEASKVPDGPSNPLDAVGKTITDAANSFTKPMQDFGNKFFEFFNLGLGVLLGIALIIVGVVLLGRGVAGRVVAGTVSDMAKGAKAAEKAAPKPVKAALTPEQKARASLDYSAARKRLASEDAKAAADAARERLRKSMGQ